MSGGVVWRMDGGPLDEVRPDFMEQQAHDLGDFGGYGGDVSLTPREAGLWRTKDGRWLEPEAMEDDHLFNVGLFVERKGLSHTRPDVTRIRRAFVQRFGCYP